MSGKRVAKEQLNRDDLGRYERENDDDDEDTATIASAEVLQTRRIRKVKRRGGAKAAEVSTKVATEDTPLKAKEDFSFMTDPSLLSQKIPTVAKPKDDFSFLSTFPATSGTTPDTTDAKTSSATLTKPFSFSNFLVTTSPGSSPKTSSSSSQPPLQTSFQAPSTAKEGLNSSAATTNYDSGESTLASLLGYPSSILTPKINTKQTNFSLSSFSDSNHTTTTNNNNNNNGRSNNTNMTNSNSRSSSEGVGSLSSFFGLSDSILSPNLNTKPMNFSLPTSSTENKSTATKTNNSTANNTDFLFNFSSTNKDNNNKTAEKGSQTATETTVSKGSTKVDDLTAGLRSGEVDLFSLVTGKTAPTPSPQLLSVSAFDQPSKTSSTTPFSFLSNSTTSTFSSVTTTSKLTTTPAPSVIAPRHLVALTPSKDSWTCHLCGNLQEAGFLHCAMCFKPRQDAPSSTSSSGSTSSSSVTKAATSAAPSATKTVTSTLTSSLWSSNYPSLAREEKREEKLVETKKEKEPQPELWTCSCCGFNHTESAPKCSLCYTVRK